MAKEDKIKTTPVEREIIYRLRLIDISGKLNAVFLIFVTFSVFIFTVMYETGFQGLSIPNMGILALLFAGILSLFAVYLIKKSDAKVADDLRRELGIEKQQQKGTTK